MPVQEERRRFARIQLDETIPGRLGETPVEIIELSVSGFRLAHEARVPASSTYELIAQWQHKAIDVICNVVRSTLFRLAKTANEKSIYHSGVRIVESIGQTDEVIRELIQDRVVQALDQQKANAHGIPPLSPFSREQKGDRFRRCELIEGVWRKTETGVTTQPLNGFTVSAGVDPQHVEILCETFAAGNAEVRRLTQVLAQLSISKTEGIKTRKYTP